jgi:NRAMP (natural resistance-associated macrophage protein)-like metal ion transporter
MYWISKSIHGMSRLKRRGLILAAVVGPGIITMVADNDAGGISTYAQTGAKTGFSLLWVILLLLPMAYYVQEMAVRLGAVTKRGHAEAIFDSFGPVWGWFSVFDLALINWLTLVTEYIGMTQAMRIFNVPEWITFLGVTLLMFGIVMSGKYWTFEKITFVFCLFNLVYIPAAIWAMQTGNVAEGWTAVGRGFIPQFHSSGTFTTSMLITLIMANIGTTITPWQIFFQQSAVVDKGMDIRDLKFGKLDTFFGSLLTCVVAAFIIIATAAVFYFNPGGQIVVESAAETAAKMPAVMPGHHWGDWAKVLFAIGLFDAGLLGALCISLSTSWAIGEVFGWAHSLNKSVRDAPWFYVVYLAMLLSSGFVSLVSSQMVQDRITVFVQVVAVTLLPAVLVFLMLLLNDKPLMGEYVNTRWQNIVNWGIVIFVIAVSTVFGVSVLYSA